MERLNAAAKHPQNQGREQQKAIKLAGGILGIFNVVDPGPKPVAESRIRSRIHENLPETRLKSEGKKFQEPGDYSLGN